MWNLLSATLCGTRSWITTARHDFKSRPSDKYGIFEDLEGIFRIKTVQCIIITMKYIPNLYKRLDVF